MSWSNYFLRRDSLDTGKIYVKYKLETIAILLNVKLKRPDHESKSQLVKPSKRLALVQLCVQRPNSESKEETSVSGQGFNINSSQLFLI